MMDTTVQTPSSPERRTPLTPGRIRAVQFTRAPFGRRGLHEDEVRVFLARLAEDAAASDAEKAALRAEIERLRHWYRNQGVEVDASASDERSRPSVQAVNLLGQAQQAADAQIAQAEDYTRQLVSLAQQQYDDILREAQRVANEAADAAGRAYQERATGGDMDTEAREQLERRIAWLRTFAEVTQVQLRSVLEALTREVDKLGDVPHGGHRASLSDKPW